MERRNPEEWARLSHYTGEKSTFLRWAQKRICSKCGKLQIRYTRDV